MQNIQLSPIKQMEAFARGIDTVVSLSQGGLKLSGIPSSIKKYLQQILTTSDSDYYGHGAGLPALREKIAHTLSERYNTQVDVDNVIITHGCSGALSTLLLMLLTEGDEVLLPQPTYPAYQSLVTLAKARSVFVPPHTNSWDISIDAIQAAATPKTKMLIFSNPTNPTGRLMPKEELVTLATWCEERGIYLIVDEVYEDYVFDAPFSSVTPLTVSMNYVIRVSSFSKNFAMSGWRVGYIVLPSHLVKQAEAIQDALIVCPSTLSQYAALKALDEQHLVNDFHALIRANRDAAIRTVDGLIKDGLPLSYTTPKAGFYLFITTQKNDTAKLCNDIVKRARVTLVPGIAFGPNGSQSIRLCYARDSDTLREGLNRLSHYWRECV